MFNLKTLRDALFVGDYGTEFMDYNDGYICDVISEIADSNVSIYNYELWNWAKDNEDYINDAIDEGLYSINPRDFNLMSLFQVGMYKYNVHNLYENLDDSIKYFVYDYLINRRGMEEIDEDLSNFIDELCDNVDNNERLEYFIEEIDEFVIVDDEE